MLLFLVKFIVLIAFEINGFSGPESENCYLTIFSIFVDNYPFYTNKEWSGEILFLLAKNKLKKFNEIRSSSFTVLASTDL